MPSQFEWNLHLRQLQTVFLSDVPVEFTNSFHRTHTALVTNIYYIDGIVFISVKNRECGIYDLYFSNTFNIVKRMSYSRP